MPAYRDPRSKVWRYRKSVRLPDGKRVAISGTPSVNNKVAAEAAERAHIERVLSPAPDAPKPKEVPTFAEWFNGRFWDEWVVSRANKPSETESKRSIYEHHLRVPLGDLRLDQIDAGIVAAFRAGLVKRRLPDGEPALSPKRINNIMAVLSTPLRYAVDIGVIASAPRVGMFKVEPPEIEWWAFDEYVAVEAAARQEGQWWHVAACLAGEAGLRVGEIRALDWAQVDLAGRTVTVAKQSRKGSTGTPKGRTRRVLPMTAHLHAVLADLAVIRRGFVVRNVDGSPVRDAQTSHAVIRILGRAGVPIRGWHSLRHTFATHAAMFGVNPWTLNSWLGHKAMEETMRYVHVAKSHARPVPHELLAAGAREQDPDRRVLAMLGARCATAKAAERSGT
jgi:integrase